MAHRDNKLSYMAMGLKEGDLTKQYKNQNKITINMGNDNPRSVKLYLNALCESNHVCDECGDKLQFKAYTPKGAKNMRQLIIAGGPLCIHYFCIHGHYTEIRPAEEWIDIFKGNKL